MATQNLTSSQICSILYIQNKSLGRKAGHNFREVRANIQAEILYAVKFYLIENLGLKNLELDLKKITIIQEGSRHVVFLFSLFFFLKNRVRVGHNNRGRTCRKTSESPTYKYTYKSTYTPTSTYLYYIYIYVEVYAEEYKQTSRAGQQLKFKLRGEGEEK